MKDKTEKIANKAMIVVGAVLIILFIIALI